MLVHKRLGEILLEKLHTPRLLAVHAMRVSGFKKVVLAASNTSLEPTIRTLHGAPQNRSNVLTAYVA
jgi:hypothetical protein